MVVGELAHERDVIIVGGGPGGYHAALRAAQIGLAVTLIEKEDIGGVCLNKGCIPSKLFTYCGEKLAEINEYSHFGIETSPILFNINTLQSNKRNLINQLQEGMKTKCKKHKVELLKGTAYFLSDEKIGFENGDQYDVYRFKHAVIATGSLLEARKGYPIDHVRILDSWSITKLNEIPEKLLIYGNDYIALEMAFAFQAFGSKVSIIFEQEDFEFDFSINKELRRILKKKNISVMRKARLIEAAIEQNAVLVTLENREATEKQFFSHLFVSTKQTPNIKNLGIERIGVETTDGGYIKINEKCQTTKQNIYAVGDVTEGQNLAVKAIKQGKTAAESIAGILTEFDLRFLPLVAHTSPPIAAVGMSEQEAVQKGHSVIVSQIPLSSNGYSAINRKKDGFIKVVFERESNRLLGMHMIGNGAIELISSGIISLEMIARDEDLQFPLYPHPSVNESLLEAVEAIKNYSSVLTSF